MHGDAYFCGSMDENNTAYELVDTHAHIYLEEFENDLQACMDRAELAGIRHIYMPSIDSHHFQRLLDVEKQYPGRCFSMAGLHPCYVGQDYREQLAFVGDAMVKRRFSAVGEIGLDYYWSREFDKEQMICFREQIDMALQQKMPIVIHSRNSMNAVIGVLKEEKGRGLQGIFHCFSGTYENAVDVLDCGFKLGIGGVVTYKNAGLAEVVARLPLDSLVLETDAPYLTPVPFRGKRNESSYIKYIAEKIALVKGVQVEEVARITTQNALELFQAE